TQPKPGMQPTTCARRGVRASASFRAPIHSDVVARDDACRVGVTRSVTHDYEELVAKLARARAPYGLHGTKVRWNSSIYHEGLARPSAAWFVLDSRSSAQVRRTIAA